MTAFGQQRDAIAHQASRHLGYEIQKILRPIFRGALIRFQCPMLAGHGHGGNDFRQLRLAGPHGGFSRRAFGHFSAQRLRQIITHHDSLQCECGLSAGVAVYFLVQLSQRHICRCRLIVQITGALA